MDILTQLLAANAKPAAITHPVFDKASRHQQLFEAMLPGELWHSERVVEHFGWNRNSVSSLLLDLARQHMIKRVGRKSVGKSRVMLYMKEESK